MQSRIKDSYYFSHDSNARNDVKIVKLRRELGPEGYGLFWMLIEVLREQNNYTLPVSAIPDIAFDFHISTEKLEAIIKRYDLFIIQQDCFYSQRLMRSMTVYDETKKKLSDAGRLGNEKRWRSGGDSGGDGNPIALKERKVNKNKVKKILNIPFEQFWDLYNKKNGEKVCTNLWIKLNDEERQKAIDQIPDYVASTPDIQYRMNPKRYLTEKAFNDQIVNNGKHGNQLLNMPASSRERL